ncbi:MAG: hypothetical protein NT077_02590, partial [Candidatus Taylorbacteria bacterium]|nr:hypothetical protein [Candidatus Taylorbacteria bacterium]
IFPSANGFDIELDLLSMFARRDSPEALARSLKYTLPELKDLIWANIKMNLTNLGGQNSYQSLLYYKADAIAWIANIFAGDGRLSLFEQQTGTTITSPLATNMGLTDETQKIFATGARIEVIVKGTDALVKAIGGGNPTPAARMEAARIAQAAEGAATRTIHTYEGIPEGATTVALGDSGIAIAAKGGK